MKPIQKKNKTVIKKQIKHPIEAKESIDSIVFAPVESNANTPKRNITTSLKGNISVNMISELNQSHRDILLTIMALAYRDNTCIFGGIKGKIEGYFACKWSDLYKRYNRNTKWILKQIDKIKSTSISLFHSKNGQTIVRSMPIITEIGFISQDTDTSNIAIQKIKEENKKKRKTNPSWFKPKVGDTFYITLSNNWITLMKLSKLRVNYSLSLIDEIREETGFVRSIIAVIIVQKVPYAISAEKLLKKIIPNWETVPQGIRRQLFTKLKKNTKTFQKYNINYNLEDKVFTYTSPCKGVGFSKLDIKLKESLIIQFKELPGI